MISTRHGRPITAEQIGEITKMFVSSLAKRSCEEAQALLEGNIGWHIVEMLDEKGDFTCDWVESDLKYPKAYRGLRPVEEQIHLLADEFRIDRKPALAFLKKGLPEVPKWAEGWAAIPIQELFRETHAHIIEKALIWHCTVCGHESGYFSSYGGLGGLTLEEHVRPHFIGDEPRKSSCARRSFAWNWKRQVGGRIMVVPVQMGALRRGQSDRMVKAHCKRRGMSEFPLGAFEVACLLAMHPERVPTSDERALEVNAPGDEYTYEGFVKDCNCQFHQMGEFRRLGQDKIPSFGFAQEGRQQDYNGPVTASKWDVKAYVESSV